MADEGTSKDAAAPAGAAAVDPRAPEPAGSGPFATRATGWKTMLAQKSAPPAKGSGGEAHDAGSKGSGSEVGATKPSDDDATAGKDVIAAAIATITRPVVSEKAAAKKPAKLVAKSKPIEKIAAAVLAEIKSVEPPPPPVPPIPPTPAAAAAKEEAPVAKEPDLAPTAEEKAKAAAPPVEPAVTEETVFGVLDSEQRIRRTSEQHERMLWMGAVLTTLIYIALIAGQAISGIAALVSPEQMQKERVGQDSNSISVEIVADPDKAAKTPHAHDGAMAPGPQPTPMPPQPPQPPQTAAVEQPDTQEPEKDPPKEPTEDHPDGSRLTLDIDSLVDAAAADLKEKIDKAFAKKPQKRQQQASVSGGDIQMRGTGAAGKSNPYSRSVIAALLKTRPGPFAIWGRVLVSFQLNEQGEISYVHMLQSSGNAALDEAAVEAIRKARFERPPPGMAPDDRTYIIDYIFG